jgi:hypothetical protein
MEPASAYLDDLGRPRLRTSVVAFVDVLGFSNLSTSKSKPEDAQRTLSLIAAAIDDSREFVRNTVARDAAGTEVQASLKFFSDNLAFACPCDADETSDRAAVRFVLRCVQRYQLRMTLNGFFVRGATCIGPICLTEEIIFGSALVECYQGESKAAIVPRILLSDATRKLLSTSQSFDDGDLICRDIDGWWFVNYLEAASEAGSVNWNFVERHKQAILESLSHATRHDVLPKFGWACRYHNVFCHWNREAAGYDDAYRIQRVDERSTIERLCDVDSSRCG